MKNKNFILREIYEIENLLRQVKDNQLLAYSYQKRLDGLKKELESARVEKPLSVSLLFSGDAVNGSNGVKAGFISEIMKSFDCLTKKIGLNQELYLTSLSHGSFGVNLEHLNNENLFSSDNTSTVLNSLNNLLKGVSEKESVDGVDSNLMKDLVDIFKKIDKQNSSLTINFDSSLELGKIELSSKSVKTICNSIQTKKTIKQTEKVECLFRGVLVDSRKFEVKRVACNSIITGNISEKIENSLLMQLAKIPINSTCIATFEVESKIKNEEVKSSKYRLIGLEKNT